MESIDEAMPIYGANHEVTARTWEGQKEYYSWEAARWQHQTSTDMSQRLYDSIGVRSNGPPTNYPSSREDTNVANKKNHYLGGFLMI